MVAVEGGGGFLGFDEAGEVGAGHPVVAPFGEGADDFVENPRFALVKVARLEQIEHGGEFRAGVDGVLRVIAGALGGHLVGGQAEEEEVLGADFFAHFDIGPIEGADGQGAVDHEFHIAGAGGFFAGGGNLLGEVGAGGDDFHGRDAVVGQKGHLQEIADVGILVDHLGDIAAQLDDALGHGVARGGLTADEHAALGPIGGVAGLDAVVEVDDVEDIEQLALVLVDALDLDVEEGIDIEADAAFFFDEIGQALLVGALDFAPFLVESLVVGKGLELAHLRQVGDPVLADALIQGLAEQGVAPAQPATLGDAIGLVVEFLRPQFVEVVEQALLAVRSAVRRRR